MPADAPPNQQQQQPNLADSGSAFHLNRRRSSLDAIAGHLKYIGAFPGRVIQDLSQPISSQPARPTLSTMFPNGFLGMQHSAPAGGGVGSSSGAGSQASFGSSQSSLGGGGGGFGSSSLNLNSAGAGGSSAAAPINIPNRTASPAPKLPGAEAYLSI
ncbi:hypothetical protein HDU87_004324 [Geranomyces variabilis]|uniref:Uncharacterized protein n=1 Tax=Geranomyces variabilis TaxID=109894 RepID=A0AAD5TIT0_9FUNG|nr:hypothetical protein HDU87_004324 [Geranomyces variabilis]